MQQTIAVRIKSGQDLAKEIERIVAENNIAAGVILSGVGSLSKSKIRVPIVGGYTNYIYPQNLEIVSLNGTISKNGNHIHISASDTEGKVWGGHLVEGSTIRTTCELVIGILSNTVFSRKLDSETGHKELEIQSSN